MEHLQPNNNLLSLDNLSDAVPNYDLMLPRKVRKVFRELSRKVLTIVYNQDKSKFAILWNLVVKDTVVEYYENPSARKSARSHYSNNTSRPKVTLKKLGQKSSSMMLKIQERRGNTLSQSVRELNLSR
jgi:hypothetical protein